MCRLAASRQVIAVDLQGHGRTPLGNRKINLIDIGNDLAVILKELGYEQVDVLGYPSAQAPASGWPFSIPTAFAASLVSAASRRTASIPRCCRCRRRSAPRWRSR